MANDNETDKTATDKTAADEGPPTSKLWVRATTKDGFRRIGRHFGPDFVDVDVTDEQAAILVNARPELEVLTPDMKAKLDEIAAGQAKLAAARAPAARQAAAAAAAKPAPRGREG